MAYMNDDLPYEEYIENRKKGGASIPSKRYTRKTLTEGTTFYMTPLMKKNMNILIQKGVFPNKAEFLRYLMIKYFEENKEWIKE